MHLQHKHLIFSNKPSSILCRSVDNGDLANGDNRLFSTDIFNSIFRIEQNCTRGSLDQHRSSTHARTGLRLRVCVWVLVHAHDRYTHTKKLVSLCYKHSTIVMQSTNPHSWSRPASLPLVARMCACVLECLYIYVKARVGLSISQMQRCARIRWWRGDDDESRIDRWWLFNNLHDYIINWFIVNCLLHYASLPLLLYIISFIDIIM